MVTRKKRSRKYLYALAGVALVIAIVAALELTNTTHIFHKEVVNLGTASSETKGEPAASPSTSQTATSTSGQTSTGQSSTDAPGDNKATPNTAATLLAPTGNFVSNHYPTLDSQLSSDCTTNSGANCQISFTKDGITKSLQPQATDRGGTTYWASWTPKSLGLTAGTWTVKATATMGTQTKSANDSLNLVVSS